MTQPPQRNTTGTASPLARGPELRVRWPWLVMSLVATVIAAAGDVTGLLAHERIYGGETALLADEAMAQDVVGLIVVAPAIIVLARMTARGSVRAYLGWLGCLVFTAYNYAIYAFSVHFGPLFLPWIAVLGLSVYATAGALSQANVVAAGAWFGGRAMPLAAWALIGFGALFGVLWLSLIVPDLLAGRPSGSALEWNVPTNPVHVLDLALFLPAVMGSGVLLLRRRALGYATAPGLLVFLALTCCPILLTPLVSAIRGHDAGAAVVAPIGLVLLATVIVLWREVPKPASADGNPELLPVLASPAARAASGSQTP